MVPSCEIPKTWRVKEISDKHHEVARMLLLGMKNKEIARDLGLSEGFVSVVKNSPVVKEQLSILQSERDREAIDIAKQIQETLPKCVAMLSGTIENPDISSSLQSRNAFGLLSIGGHGNSKNVSVKGIHAVLTVEEIREIRERGQILAEEIGLISDVQEAEVVVEGNKA